MPVGLDTTVLIDVLRGRPGTGAGISELEQSGDRVFTSVVNVEELVRGLRGSGEEEAAARLLGGLRLAPLGREEGEQAGRWRREHARRGVTLSQSELPEDAGILREIAQRLDAQFGVYAEVLAPGEVRVGDPVLVT